MYLSKCLQNLPTNSCYHSSKCWRTLKIPEIGICIYIYIYIYIYLGLPLRCKWSYIKRKRHGSIKTCINACIMRASFSVVGRYFIKSFFDLDKEFWFASNKSKKRNTVETIKSIILFQLCRSVIWHSIGKINSKIFHNTINTAQKIKLQ